MARALALNAGEGEGEEEVTRRPSQGWLQSLLVLAGRWLTVTVTVTVTVTLTPPFPFLAGRGGGRGGVRDLTEVKRRRSLSSGSVPGCVVRSSHAWTRAGQFIDAHRTFLATKLGAHTPPGGRSLDSRLAKLWRI